ncbi:hypothetical protein D9611_011609 [Ephemerocybe angulata]|uniref:Uncharacterized protein n=1 Tax=Ephemerocybe angulata TaxID=980116 RepID=A0A8H5AV59_9AGAR|nr:hypothetical protein D9611_011609 [Tulosesus angulatus]
MFTKRTTYLALLAAALGGANAHLAAWHEGMYCLNGNTGNQDLNSYDIVTPLYQLPFRDWWFHHVNRCDEFPPAEGKYIDLPAGGSFKIEIASNRAKTELSYGGRDTSEWPDGQSYPQDYHDAGCITSPNMHAQDQSRAAGTAFAISYHSDLKDVTPENLVVFSVRYNTPWKRVIYYDVPSALPACPPDGCTCAWGWVPNGCGQPNMYHQAFKCRVSNAKSSVPVKVPAKAPRWCEGDEGGCVGGAKQMIYWNQKEGNNVVVDGRDRRGDFKSPGYNMGMGFRDGAQNDIFGGSPTQGSSSSSSSKRTSSTTKPTSTQGAKVNNAQPTSTAAGSSPTSSSSGSSSGSSSSSSSSGDKTTGNSLTGSSSSSSSSPAETPKAFSEKAQRPQSCQRKRRRAAAERREMEAREEVRREEVRREEVRREEVRREDLVKREEVKRAIGGHHAVHAKRSF